MTSFQVIILLKKRIFSVILLAFSMVLVTTTSPVIAQETVWIQLESQNSLRDTKERAQAYAQTLPETKAFLTTTGWYAIVVGPLSPAEANGLITRLKIQQQIPAEAFIANGRTFISQLWPLAASTETQPATGVVVVTDPTPEPEPEPTPEPEAETAIAPVETPAVEEPPALIEDPDIKATRALERTWTRQQKMDYQVLMAWTGDYKFAIDGSYGPGTRGAIKKFQEREGYEPTGYLTEAQVALLQKRYDDSIAFLGMETTQNLDAGIEIPMPKNLVEFERFEPPFIHFKPRGADDVRVILISQEGNRDTLISLYDIMETFDYIPAEGYRVQKRDWFVLSGHNDEIVSYTYAKTEKGKVKGFTLVWTPDLEAKIKPLATAMYKDFKPLHDYVLDETIGYGQGEDEPVDLTTGIDTPQPDRSATGFFINGDGAILTHVSNIKGCQRVTIGDDQVELELIAQNRNIGLAALRPKVEILPQSYALFSDETPELGAEIMVAGFSFPDVMEVATLNYGTLTDTNGMLGNTSLIRVSAFLEKGDVGGPVLDDRGAVIGMQLQRGGAAESLPEYVNFALKSSQIIDLLDRHGLVYGKTTAIESIHAEDMAYMAGDFTVKVSCWE